MPFCFFFFFFVLFFLSQMDSTDLFSSGRGNFSKIFMQLMCPSCCGGLFTEPKGSVYMKRQSKIRQSETKSVITTIFSENEADRGEAIVENNISATTNEVNKCKTNSIIDEKKNETEEQKSNKMDDDVENNSQENLTFVYTPVLQNTTRGKLFTNVTIEDEMDMLTKDKELNKNRSMSLNGDISGAFNQELTRSLRTDGEANWNNKLRKTSYPTDISNHRDIQIIEMKIRGKEFIKVEKQDENEAPFNFQAILRKTNNNRESLRRLKDVPVNQIEELNYFVSELLPGVVLRGNVYDL